MASIYLPIGFQWPKPWRKIEESDVSNEVVAPQPYASDPKDFTFEAELRYEVCFLHPLYGIECSAVARSTNHPDEFIFATARSDMPVAFVHLTWQSEESPEFPYTVGYTSWEAFVEAWQEL